MAEGYDESVTWSYYDYGNGSGYYDYFHEYYDHYYQIFDFEVPIFGYIWPILVIFIACCNVLVIAGFLRPRMRTPTNAILISIAVSDSLTGLVTLPASFYIFSQNKVLLSPEWCNINMISRLYISRAFHTISIWQTLALGIHRYMTIRNPLTTQRWCTMRNTLIGIAVIYVLAFVLHMYHAFNIKAVAGMCSWLIEEPCGGTCVYLWFTLLLVYILPGLVLLLLTLLMIPAVRRTNQSAASQPRDARRREEQARTLTIVVVIIVVIFLIPELPYGIFHLITVSQIHAKKAIFPLETNRIIHCTYELLLAVSFHLNFWVYCLMMPSFRSCVKGVFQLARCQKVDFNNMDNDAESHSSTVGIQMSPVDMVQANGGQDRTES